MGNICASTPIDETYERSMTSLESSIDRLKNSIDITKDASRLKERSDLLNSEVLRLKKKLIEINDRKESLDSLELEHKAIIARLLELKNEAEIISMKANELDLRNQALLKTLIARHSQLY
jgi:hypothetical protein